MIVNYSDQGWEIITQRAHGILAAEIGLRWRTSDRPARWLETLLAIAEHDDAEVELDGENLLTANGGPLNYAMKTFDLAHCEKLDRMTLTKSRYIRLLTSMHLEFLYGKERKSNQAARTFLNGQNKIRKRICQEIGMTRSDLKKTYDFMEWCDAFSLLLCEDQVQAEKRMTEISTGPNQKPYQVLKLKENVLTVLPWPFEPDSFDLQFEKRLVPHLAFKSSADFRMRFLKSAVVTTGWTIRKKPKSFRPPKKVK